MVHNRPRNYQTLSSPHALTSSSFFLAQIGNYHNYSYTWMSITMAKNMTKIIITSQLLTPGNLT